MGVCSWARLAGLNGSAAVMQGCGKSWVVGRGLVGGYSRRVLDKVRIILIGTLTGLQVRTERQERHGQCGGKARAAVLVVVQ